MSNHWRHYPRFIFFTVALIIGGILSYLLIPAEISLTEKYLKSYPESYAPLHQLRPYLLITALFMPALGGLIYAFLGILDRYLIRKFFSVFTICLFGFILIWLLLDWQNVYSDFGDISGQLPLIGNYYLIQIPSLLVLMGPFVLLLSCLFVLGQLSNHREIISMIQTGRGLVRVVLPLISLGIYISIFLSILNFHWAPWGEAYKDGLKDVAKHDSLTRARDVVANHKASGRLWYIGLFPRDYYEGAALRNLEITFPSESGIPQKRLRIDEATWDKETGDWVFSGISELNITDQPIPQFLPKVGEQIIKGWAETPSQLVSPSLEPSSLGLPELEDWLRNHNDETWIDHQPVKTQWHNRIAKPWSCLVAVLLAAPLGVVFSRRGAFSGIVVAIILCVLLFFSNEIFLAMGNGGYLIPWVAAWSANIIFAFIAFILLFRRVQNRPIYQSLRSFFALFGGKA